MEAGNEDDWAVRGENITQEWDGNSSLIIDRNETSNATSLALVPPLPAYIAYTSFVLFSLVLAVGAIGNVLVILVLISYKSMRTSTNLFLLNLSIADLLVLIICCPNAMVEMYMRRDIWVMGEAMCKLVPFIELTVSHTSVLTILAITVERYYAVCLPLHAGRIWTKGKAGLVCLVSWLLSVILTSPLLAIANYKADPETPTCTTDVDPTWTKVYFLSIISLFFWLPLAVLVMLYAVIARNLTMSARVTKHAGSTHSAHCVGGKVIPGTEPAAVTKGRRQIVRMLGTVVIFFFACLLPFKVLTIWVVISPYEIHEHINMELFYNLLYFSRLMFYINSAINPILYNTMSSRFRERFRRFFGCGNSSQRPTSHTESTRFSSSQDSWRKKGENRPGLHHSTSSSALVARQPLCQDERRSASFHGSSRSQARKTSLLKVASILSFSQFIENSKETYI